MIHCFNLIFSVASASLRILHRQPADASCRMGSFEPIVSNRNCTTPAWKYKNKKNQLTLNPAYLAVRQRESSMKHCVLNGGTHRRVFTLVPEYRNKNIHK